MNPADPSTPAAAADLWGEVGPSAGPGRGTVTVLGCCGSYPGPGGAGSSYLVRSGASAVWLDAGPGSFANLQRFGDPAELDAVVLSHEHPDHWSDFDSLVTWSTLRQRQRPIPVYAPPGLRRRSYYAEHPLVDWQVTVPDQQVTVGCLTLRFAATDHGPPTLAVRVDAPDPAAPAPADADDPDPAPDPPASSALAYSADSGPEWSVEQLGWGVGTFLCEASFTREHEGRIDHLSGRQAGAMAADADVCRLVLTHRWPTVSAEAVADEAASSFGASVEQCSLGAVFDW